MDKSHKIPLLLDSKNIYKMSHLHRDESTSYISSKLSKSSIPYDILIKIITLGDYNVGKNNIHKVTFFRNKINTNITNIRI